MWGSMTLHHYVLHVLIPATAVCVVCVGLWAITFIEGVSLAQLVREVIDYGQRHREALLHVLKGLPDQRGAGRR